MIGARVGRAYMEGMGSMHMLDILLLIIIVGVVVGTTTCPTVLTRLLPSTHTRTPHTYMLNPVHEAPTPFRT